MRTSGKVIISLILIVLLLPIVFSASSYFIGEKYGLRLNYDAFYISLNNVDDGKLVPVVPSGWTTAHKYYIIVDPLDSTRKFYLESSGVTGDEHFYTFYPRLGTESILDPNLPLSVFCDVDFGNIEAGDEERLIAFYDITNVDMNAKTIRLNRLIANLGNPPSLVDASGSPVNTGQFILDEMRYVGKLIATFFEFLFGG